MKGAEIVAEEVSGSRSNRNSRKRSVRQELRARLQSVKLTSESGNASVIEVIEPSSSDDDASGDAAGGMHPLDQSTPIRSLPKARSFNASFSDELEKARQKKILRPSVPLPPLPVLPAGSDASSSLDLSFS